MSYLTGQDTSRKFESSQSADRLDFTTSVVYARKIKANDKMVVTNLVPKILILGEVSVLPT